MVASDLIPTAFTYDFTRRGRSVMDAFDAAQRLSLDSISRAAVHGNPEAHMRALRRVLVDEHGYVEEPHRHCVSTPDGFSRGDVLWFTRGDATAVISFGTRDGQRPEHAMARN